MNYFSGWKKLQAKLLVVFCHSFLLPSILHVHSPLFSILYPVPFSPYDISFAATFLERIPPSPSMTFEWLGDGQKTGNKRYLAGSV